VVETEDMTDTKDSLAEDVLLILMPLNCRCMFRVPLS
jgi:hypothetical protein